MLLRFLALALGLSLAGATLPTVPAVAQTARVVVDGQLMGFDQAPVVTGGRVLVPLRGVFEHLGATVLWDPATNVVTAQRSDTQVQLVIGGRQANINGRTVLLDVPARIVGGRTLVPLRFVSEAMGAQVDWDNATRVVTITSGTTALPVQPPAPAPEPAAAAPPVGNIQISSFAHNATAPLRAGSQLTVTLRGTPGGRASFDIFGADSDVAMRQVSPGLYRGRYTVRAQDNVTAAAVVGRLRVNGQVAPLVQARTAVTLDGMAPQIVQLFPERGQTVNNVRPNILIVFNDAGSGVDPTRSRLLVNGQNVTAQVSITETALAYSPPEALSGRVLVRVVLADKAGNVMDEQYAFTTVTSQTSLIRSVTISPTTPLRPRDVLTVRMLGEPGGQASFTIEGVVEESIPMAEAANQRGVYVGSHTIGRREQGAAQNARIIVRLTKGGVVSQAEVARLMVVATETVAPPTITSPVSGTRLGSPIVVRGRATSGYRVEVQVDYRGSMLVFGLKGTYGKVMTTANAAGDWTVRISETVRIPNAELTITAVTIDPVGRRSEPVTIGAVLAGVWPYPWHGGNTIAWVSEPNNSF